MEPGRGSSWLNVLVGLLAALGLALMLWLGWSAPAEPPAEEVAAPTPEPTADPASRPARPTPPARRSGEPAFSERFLLLEPGQISGTLQLPEWKMPVNPGAPTAPMPVLPGEKTVPMPDIEPPTPTPAPQPSPTPLPRPEPTGEPVS